MKLPDSVFLPLAAVTAAFALIAATQHAAPVAEKRCDKACVVHYAAVIKQKISQRRVR